MISALATAAKLDWSGWILGIWGAAVSGGAGAVSSGFGTMIVDPEHFNIAGGGLKHVLLVMGICFAFSAIISLAKFLPTHPVPDALQQKLQVAAVESEKAVVQAQKTADAIGEAKAKAEAPKP